MYMDMDMDMDMDMIGSRLSTVPVWTVSVWIACWCVYIFDRVGLVSAAAHLNLKSVHIDWPMGSPITQRP